jgi:hypothetical protein
VPGPELQNLCDKGEELRESTVRNQFRGQPEAALVYNEWASRLETAVIALRRTDKENAEAYSNAYSRFTTALKNVRVVLHSHPWEPSVPPSENNTETLNASQQNLCPSEQAKGKGKKASVSPGEAENKLIGALCNYHEFSDDGCGNFEPVGVNELARLAGCSSSTASLFIRTNFGSLDSYKNLCSRGGEFVLSLRLLRREVDMLIRQVADGSQLADRETD